MKYIILLFTILLTHTTYIKTDPFAHANYLYEHSMWEDAYTQFNKIHNDILLTENIDITDLELIKGHVNYADVLFAKAIGTWNSNNHNQAIQLMLEACNHWPYRLHAGKFGRKPLDNEWDGSDIQGKTIVIFSERDNGALGDTFFMTRMLRYVKKKGAYVIFVPQKHLAQLYDCQCLPEAEQTKYVDKVVLRSEELPEHDCAIYLWSILKYYLNDTTITEPFPFEPCFSGDSFYNEKLSEKIAELTEKYGTKPFLIGIWWRSSGPTSMAADRRMLERDPGIHNMLKVLQNLPILIINLEGFGRIPLSKQEYKMRKKDGTLGIHDFVDMTTYPLDNIFNFDADFDKEIAFNDQ